MKTIKLKILAEDIKTTKYHWPNDCAITKALKRAGLSAHEGGGNIHLDTNHWSLISTPLELRYKVLAMYAHADISWNRKSYPNKWTKEVAETGTLIPEDFEFTVEVPDEWIV